MRYQATLLKVVMSFLLYRSDMRFYDTGDTTPKDSNNRPESHYDHLLVSHSMRLLHRYYPPALPGKRLNELYKKFVSVSNVRNEPVARSYDLSDHLPVRFQDPPTGAKIGTWNLLNFNVFDVDEPDEKEFVYSGAYTGVFDRFHILALQELSGFASNLYGKMLKVSPVTNELGIAYDSNYVTLVECSDLKVPFRRGMFGCTFETNGMNKKVTRYITVYIQFGCRTLIFLSASHSLFCPCPKCLQYIENGQTLSSSRTGVCQRRSKKR